MPHGVLTDHHVRRFHEDGYYIARGLYDAEEMKLLSRAARKDKALDDHAIQRKDGEGGIAKLTLWNHPGEDIYGMFSRGRRLVDSMEKCLGGEVYHYHSKMNMKEPRVGGAWAWHQDYGYWYQNGCLFPYMASVMIAVDAATRENGCLQVIRGSHHMGRIDHVLAGDQAGADIERVNVALQRLELVYVEMEVGDALLLLVIENVWATGLRDALRNAGIVFAEQDYVTPEGLVALGGLLGVEVAFEAGA